MYLEDKPFPRLVINIKKPKKTKKNFKGESPILP